MDTWFLRVLVGTLTILFNFPAFSQQAKPLFIVNSIPAYKQLVRASPGQKLVRISSFLHPVYSNIYYSTSQNFTHTILYGKDHELYLVEKAAKQLALVQDSLQIMGLDLLIFDCYRPYQFTKKMWE